LNLDYQLALEFIAFEYLNFSVQVLILDSCSLRTANRSCLNTSSICFLEIREQKKRSLSRQLPNLTTLLLGRKLMIIVDLPCLAVISAQDRVIGGANNYYDNKSAATALAYADGSEVVAAAGTSVYLDRGVSKASGFAEAQALY
jgi:hypothetical protein